MIFHSQNFLHPSSIKLPNNKELFIIVNVYTRPIVSECPGRKQ